MNEESLVDDLFTKVFSETIVPKTIPDRPTTIPFDKTQKHKTHQPAWHNDPASPKQLAYLRGLGYTGPVSITKKQAADQIDRLKRRS